MPSYDIGEFLVDSPQFTGTLVGLAQALRDRKLTPKDINVLTLVRQYLAYYQGAAAQDLELATETLPQLARVIELKARLLLPKPRVEEDEALEETIHSIDMLAELEEAIHFLRKKRDARRHLLTVKVARPPYPREERALKLPPSRLAELASRYRTVTYFELARERFTLEAATQGILQGLSAMKRGVLQRLGIVRDWPSLGVTFAAMLELVKEGKVSAQQDVPFGPIEVERLEQQEQEAA